MTLSDARCRFDFSRRAPGVLEVRIEGTDKGQFGTAALDEIALTIAIAKHLSETGNLIQIYTDPSLFEARKAR